jgi:hypothetical protein
MLLSFADMFILNLRVAISYTQHSTDLAHTSTLCDSALYCRLQVLAFLFVRHDTNTIQRDVSHEPTF